MTQILERVDILYALAKKEKESSVNEYRVLHNALSIFGNRGAGKTTFLLTTIRQIEQKYPDTVCLSPIDPSMIECKQHPFVNVFAAIHKRVEHYIEESEPFQRMHSNYELGVELKARYKQLLNGIASMDGIGKENVYEDWDDDTFISAKGMKKAELSNDLNRHFNEYVRIALRLMGKTCFVVSFDDIDTNFQKGYELLEVIRKFLTSPQIITILTGDLELYGKLVRKSLWECFNRDFIVKEMRYANRSKDEFSMMVNNLENQYLMKILKPENRVHLRTVQEITEDGMVIKILISNRESTLDGAYNLLLRELGVPQSNYKLVENITRFLKGISLRAQIRLLHLYNHSIGNKEGRKIDIAGELLNIFWNDVSQKAKNAKAFLRSNNYYAIEMQRFLVFQNILHTSCDFMPDTHDDTLNKALLAIGSRFNQQLRKKPFMVFDYWLRLSYLQYATEFVDAKNKPEGISKFIQYSMFDSEDDLCNSIGLAQAYCNHIVSKNIHFIENKTMPGTMILQDYAVLHRFDKTSMLARIPMLGTVNSYMENTVFASIYRLFAILRDLLLHIGDDMDIAQKEYGVFLKKQIQYRNYMEPVDASFLPSNNQTQPQYFFEGNIHSSDNRFDDLINDLFQWKSSYPSKVCTTQLLNRIFTRFYFTMVNIDKSESHQNVGEKLNAYIAALLNAILVEEAIEENNSEMLFDNIFDAESLFLYNAMTVEELRKKNKIFLHFYNWMFQCPLLRLYINPFVLQIIGKNYSSSLSLSMNHYHKMLNKRKDTDEYLKVCKVKVDNFERANKWIETFKQQYKSERNFKEKEQKYPPLKGGISKSEDSFRREDYLIGRKQSTGKQIEDVVFLKDEGIYLGRNCSIEYVSEVEEKLLELMKNLQKEIGKAEIALYGAEADVEDVASFVISDHDKFIKTNKIDNHSVYDYLCKIKVAEFQKYTPSDDTDSFPTPF